MVLNWSIVFYQNNGSQITYRNDNKEIFKKCFKFNIKSQSKNYSERKKYQYNHTEIELEFLIDF